MIVAFKQAIDLLFARLGVVATYSDATKQEAVMIIIKSPDRIMDFKEAHIHTPSNIIEVRRSEVPHPKAGDLIKIGQTSYKIQGEPKVDQHQLVWTLNVVKQCD